MGIFRKMFGIDAAEASMKQAAADAKAQAQAVTEAKARETQALQEAQQLSRANMANANMATVVAGGTADALDASALVTANKQKRNQGIAQVLGLQL